MSNVWYIEAQSVYGKCNIPQKAVYECNLEGLGENDGVYHYVGNLGRWLTHQRQAKKGKGNWKITPERLARRWRLVYLSICV